MGHCEKPRWGLTAPEGTWHSLSPLGCVGCLASRAEAPSPGNGPAFATGRPGPSLQGHFQKVPLALPPGQPQGKAAGGQPSSSQGFRKAAGETTLWAQKQQNCYLTPQQDGTNSYFCLMFRIEVMWRALPALVVRGL